MKHKLTYLSLVGLIPIIISAGPIDGWLVANNLTNVVRLNDIAFGNGRFVAVGEKTIVSTNGLEWRITSKTNMSSVSFGAGTFVAVGGKFAYTSSDGVTWTQRTVSLATYIDSVTFGNDKFLLVGDQGLVSTAPTGKLWDSTNTPFGLLFSSCFQDGRFYCSGEDGYGYSTVDGLNLTKITDLQLLQLIKLGGTFYSPSSKLQSTNGLNWTTNTTSALPFKKLIRVGITALGVGLGSSVWATRDGTNWIEHPTGLPNSTTFLNSIAFGNGVCVVVGLNTSFNAVIGRSDMFESPSVGIQMPLSLQVSGKIGWTYGIQAIASTNSTNWETVGQVTLTAPQTWVALDTTNQPQRFYRALVLP